MHARRPGKITSPIVSLSTSYVKLVPLGFLIGAVGLGLAYFMSLPQGGLKRFSYSYLVTYCSLLSMSLGCLFFVTVQHLTRAGWSVTVRRIAEIFAMCLIPMFVLFLPILLPVLMQRDDVYQWVNAGWLAGDREIFREIKNAYLSPTWFGIRIVTYFVIWGLMAYSFFGKSLKQDKTADPMLSRTMQKSATWKMIILAATLVFASFDMEMSLSPRWFSTMFPVYFFAGGVMSAMAAIILTAALLQRSGRVTDEITVEHYHDLAKLTFAFIFFWGYIAFSQFMLIWYANLPEETFWFRFRMGESASSGWIFWSLLLLFGHLLIPFLGMMARTVRRNKTYLLFATIFILCMHWVDHFWIIMPQLNIQIGAIDVPGGDPANNPLPFNWLIDVPCAIGMVGIFVALFSGIAADRPLVPLHDPRLEESLNYRNA